MSKTISQSEARAYRKRANALAQILRDQRRTWGEDWPLGELIRVIDTGHDSAAAVAIRTARKLGHAVVATIRADGTAILLFAIPHPEMPV